MVLETSNDDTETRDSIFDSLTALIEPGQVTELRILGIGGDARRTAAGYFNDMRAATREAMRYEGRAAGVYLTPNPVAPRCSPARPIASSTD